MWRIRYLRICEAIADTNRPIAFIEKINAAPRYGLTVGKDNGYASTFYYEFYKLKSLNTVKNCLYEELSPSQSFAWLTGVWYKSL